MAGAPQVTGICSVAVQVRNLDRSLAFYRDVLGLRLGHREGWIAQLHGQGGAPPTLVLLEVGERTIHYSGGPGLARVAWRVGTQADLDLAEHLLKSQGLPCQRRREDGGDIVDTRDPDRTHVLLVWLDDAQLAGDRLPPGLYTHE
jgi:catechol 2,3-dioxygenase-like lactoylglutathione lyase family enzyme